MPDGTLHGIDFASRLVSNIYGLHKQKQDEEKATAENSRQTMLKILESAADSGNVNPEDMPTLYQQLFQLTGAKSKEVETVGEHVRGLFSHPSVARKGAGTFGPSSQQGGYDYQTPMAGGESATVHMPEYTVPGVPQETTNMGPGIRMMGPDEKAAQATRAEVARQQALQPGEINKQREIYSLKTDAQRQAIRDRTAGRLQEIAARGDEKAQATFQQRYSANLQSGMEDEDAKGEAAQFVKNLMDVGIGVKQSQIGVNNARILDMQGRLVDMQFRSQQLKKKTDAYVTHLAALNANPGASRGSVSKANTATFTAYTKELYPAYTALKKELVKLKTDPDVDREDPDVKANISYLESEIAGVETKLKNARDTWLPKQPLPEGMTGPASDGKHHYTPAQIRASLKNGWTYDMAVKRLQSLPDVVIDQ